MHVEASSTELTRFSMELDDIKKNKLQRAKDRELSNAKLWSKFKTYGLILIISFLLIKSDLYTLTTVSNESETLTEICFSLGDKENDYSCKRSVVFKNLSLF